MNQARTNRIRNPTLLFHSIGLCIVHKLTSSKVTVTYKNTQYTYSLYTVKSTQQGILSVGHQTDHTSEKQFLFPKKRTIYFYPYFLIQLQFQLASLYLKPPSGKSTIWKFFYLLLVSPFVFIFHIKTAILLLLVSYTFISITSLKEI